MKRCLIIVTFLYAFIIGCSSVSWMQYEVDKINSQLESSYAPVRAKLTSYGGGATGLQVGLWAGEPGVTAFHEQQQALIFENIQKNCGYKEESLVEFRIVKHTETLWNEVWVFSNPESKREDKQSGVSVLVRFNPQTQMTQTSFPTGC